MRDGSLRRAVKRVALWNFRVNLSVQRAFKRWRGPAPYLLGGECRRSGTCCEAPALKVGWPVWYLPRLRRLFLWWQEAVNGWVAVGQDREQRGFVFRCTHYDAASRSCDSYASRPGVCRDYPRLLLDQPSPELHPDCGYRPVARGAARMLRVLEAQQLTAEQMQALKTNLHLEP